MSFDRRLAFAALIVTLVGLATTYLWPDKKWIGWLSLAVVLVLLFLWASIELRAQPGLRSAFLLCSVTVAICVSLIVISRATPNEEVVATSAKVPATPSPSEITHEVTKELPQPKTVLESNTHPKEQSPQPSKRRATPIEQLQRPYDLTGARRKKFLELLGKAQSEPRDILRIGCISWSDAACVAAGKFLILFSEAGWTIDSNRVYRLEPSIPIDGMAMVSHIDSIDDAQKLPPHLGVWRKMDASQITIWWAFKEMGIPTSGSSDPSIPAGILGIYFGPEPQSK